MSLRNLAPILLCALACRSNDPVASGEPQGETLTLDELRQDTRSAPFGVEAFLIGDDETPGSNVSVVPRRARVEGNDLVPRQGLIPESSSLPRRPGLYLRRSDEELSFAPLTDTDFAQARQIFALLGDPNAAQAGDPERHAALVLPWRVLDEGMSLEDALRQARAEGLADPELEAKVRAYVEREQRP